VEKAIRDSGLGLNPQAEGQTIRVPIPQLSEERRQEMSKVASKYAEQARVAVRNVRRDAMEKLKKAQKDGEIPEDDYKRWADELQKITDQHVKQIDDLLEHKEQEMMQV
jgi:ribosome recycling factor